MPKSHRDLGIGATMSVHARFLEPKSEIRARLGPTYQTAVLASARVDGYEEQAHADGVKKVILHLSHPDFPALLLKAPAGSVSLLTKGPEDQALSHLLAPPAPTSGEPVEIS